MTHMLISYYWLELKCFWIELSLWRSMMNWRDTLLVLNMSLIKSTNGHFFGTQNESNDMVAEEMSICRFYQAHIQHHDYASLVHHRSSLW